MSTTRDLPLPVRAFAAAALVATTVIFVHLRWIAPFHVTENATVRFVPDDVHGAPTVRFVRAPRRPLRAVFEREAPGEPTTWLAAVELGIVEEGDEISAGWRQSQKPDDMRLVVRHDTAEHVIHMGRPIPSWQSDAVIAITRTDHPVDEAGRIVLEYALPADRLDEGLGVEAATTRVLLRFEETGPPG